MSLDPTLTVNNFFKQSENIPVNDKWDILWKNACTPWDRGGPSPSLVELLEDKHFPLVPSEKAGKAKGFVPGCGRGWDVAFLAGLTAPDQKLEKVVGLDISTTAMEVARKVHQEATGVEFVQGDFFSKTEKWFLEAPYDVVYDYTVPHPSSSLSSFSVRCRRICALPGLTAWPKLSPRAQDC